MKTLKKIISSLIVIGLCSNVLNASTPSKKEDISNFKIKIVIPEELRVAGYAENVKVIFKLDEQNKVSEVIAQTVNKVLKSSIEEQIRKGNFSNLDANQVYAINIKLQVI